MKNPAAIEVVEDRRRKDWLMATSTMRLRCWIPGAYARRIGTWHPTKTGWRWNPIWEWTPLSWTSSEAAARTKASNSKPRQPTNRLGTEPMPSTLQRCLPVSASTLVASLASDPRRYSGRIPRKGLSTMMSRILDTGSTQIQRTSTGNAFGASVRCVKDTTE